jgi:hypothetical protein
MPLKIDENQNIGTIEVRLTSRIWWPLYLELCVRFVDFIALRSSFVISRLKIRARFLAFLVS